jgi:transcriptional regulator with XRE-family HTH domain
MNVKYFRQERGLSQFELAAVTGIPRYRIQLFEQNIQKPTLKEIEVIAQALGLEMKGNSKWALKTI